MPKHADHVGGSARPFGVFRFTSPAHEPVIVLALDIWAAVRALRRWRLAKKIGEAQFQVEPRWGRHLSRGGRAHLDEAVQRCRASSLLVGYRGDVGWSLKTFPDHGNDP